MVSPFCVTGEITVLMTTVSSWLEELDTALMVRFRSVLSTRTLLETGLYPTKLKERRKLSRLRVVKLKLPVESLSVLSTEESDRLLSCTVAPINGVLFC